MSSDDSADAAATMKVSSLEDVHKLASDKGMAVGMTERAAQQTIESEAKTLLWPLCRRDNVARLLQRSTYQRQRELQVHCAERLVRGRRRGIGRDGSWYRLWKA